MHSAVTRGGIQRLALINHPQWAAEVFCAQDGKLARMKKKKKRRGGAGGHLWKTIILGLGENREIVVILSETEGKALAEGRKENSGKKTKRKTAQLSSNKDQQKSTIRKRTEMKCNYFG